jgi:hypothetical protein
MKPLHIVLVIIGGAIVLTVIGFLFADFANAQTPTPTATYPDVDLPRQGSSYTFRCQPVEPIDKLTQICAARTDLPEIVELGCVDHSTIDAAPMTVTVERTPHVDGEIRCYAADSEGNLSDMSDNAGLVDFTPPGKPHVE